MALLLSRSQRLLASARRVLPLVQAQLPAAQALSDLELAPAFARLRAERAQGAKWPALLPRAFALIHEAVRRGSGLTPYPVQVLGGIVLSKGQIAQMRTGEGKTLVAAFPAALWALAGEGVHVVTANDYLAKRDSAWMATALGLLGLQVGTVFQGQSREEKVQAYAADITYGTSSEFGFDYLRDQMQRTRSGQVRRPQAYALVDEVDSLLIDEARTPLVISGDGEAEEVAIYARMHRLVQQLVRQEDEHAPGDYWVDEKNRQVHLSEAGQDRLEGLLRAEQWLSPEQSLYDPHALELLHHADVALRAHALLRKDVDYVVAQNQVVLVDPFTGRTQPGRRWNHGLHQAVEAKEGLTPEPESRVMASIAIQHYFGGYRTLAGMTGTAMTEATEFREIYNLDVVEVPTHRPMVRVDHPDVVCVTKKDKLARIVAEIKQCHAKSQPVLVGTPSVAASEELAALLVREGLAFSLLNAKNHAAEAQIIANAGAPGAITLATSMAGRGTDILLGGSLEARLARHPSPLDASARAALVAAWEADHAKVMAAGGLHVIGTERQESRRIDDQLRGRAGRQGDPGSSRFYLSLEDDLLRIFATGWAKRLLAMMGVVEGRTIEDARITKHIARAQKQVEAHNFNARKSLIDYDQVVHEQRLHVYAQRQQLLEQALDLEEARETAWSVLHPAQPLESGAALVAWVNRWSPTRVILPESMQSEFEAMEDNSLREQFQRAWFDAAWDQQAKQWGEQWETQVRLCLLDALDTQWRAHLDRLGRIRQGIHLRGYAQKQPLQEYRKDGHESFLLAWSEAREQAVVAWMTQSPAAPGASVEASPLASAPSPVAAPVAGSSPPVQFRQVARNALCPCGSGQRYKACHGRLD